MSEVNRLRREERELGLQAQELEIEDNLARCETVSTNGNYKLTMCVLNACSKFRIIEWCFPTHY